MAYKLELSSGEQQTLLSSTVQKWSNCQPDMYIISMEGHKIYTQRILLGLHSNLIDSLLTSTAGGGADLPGISVPASSGSLVNLVKILSTGVAIATNKSHLLETTKAAEAIGIKLENCQIGIKKKKPEVVKQPSPNNRKRKFPGVEATEKKMKLKDEVKKEFNDQEDGNPTPDIMGMSSNSGPQKKHHCDQCDKTFSSKQALQRHVLLHSENPTPFGCDKCEKKYDRKYRLEKHKKTEAEAELENVQLDENEVLGEAGMEMEDLEAPDLSDPVVKEKLLADRQKLLAELNSLEGQGDLDFLNTE